MLKNTLRMTLLVSAMVSGTAFADQCSDVLVGIYDQNLYQSDSARRDAMYQSACGASNTSVGASYLDIGLDLDYAQSKCSTSQSSMEWFEQVRSKALSVNPMTIDAWNQCMNRNGLHVSMYKKASNTYTVLMDYRPANPTEDACIAGGVGGFNIAFGGRITPLGSPSNYQDAEVHPNDCDRKVLPYVRKEWTLLFEGEDPGVAVVSINFSNASPSSTTQFYIDTRY